MEILSLKNLSYQKQGKQILDQINWTVNEGETWAILGLNGAGKSSLLRLITAEFWASQGQIQLLGVPFGKGDIPALRKKIGIVGTHIAERFAASMKAEEIVLTGRYKSSLLYTQIKKEEMNLAKELLSQLGNGNLIGRTYASLSQGERQSVLIARALMDQPQVLILDEASNGLDLFAKEALLKQVGQLAQLEQLPLLIYVTHHIDEISDSFSHLLLLKDGHIHSQGPKDQILDQANLSDFYGRDIKKIPLEDGRYYILDRGDSHETSH